MNVLFSSINYHESVILNYNLSRCLFCQNYYESIPLNCPSMSLQHRTYYKINSTIYNEVHFIDIKLQALFTHYTKKWFSLFCLKNVTFYPFVHWVNVKSYLIEVFFNRYFFYSFCYKINIEEKFGFDTR